MAGLSYCHEVDSELEVLAVEFENEVALIDALLEELGNDQEMLQRLTQDTPHWHWDYEPAFEIKRFEECWKTGRRVYLLKPYDDDGHLSDFRILIGHDVDTDEYFVLSAQPRKTSYDPATEAFRRVCSRYDGLHIPPIRQA